MKIIYENENKSRTVRHINKGTIFLYEDSVYMRVDDNPNISVSIGDDVLCVNLTTNMLAKLSATADVVPIEDAHLQLPGWCWRER